MADTKTERLPVGIVGDKIEEIDRTINVTEAPALPINEKLKSIGKPTSRIDGRAKVTGAAKYTADVNLPGLLYGRMVCSAMPSAYIKSIDTSKAESLPGVKAVHVLEKVLGVAEVKGEKQTKYPRIRFAGQPIAAIAAVSPQIAEDAVRLIKVEYDELPFVVDIEKAKEANAPTVFEAPAEQAGTAGGGGGPKGVQQKGNVRGPAKNAKGDVAKGFSEADVVVEGQYRTQVQTHSALETHGIVADWKPDKLNVWASTQGTLSVRDELANVFELKKSQVQVITEYMGGGFGAKFGAGNYGVLATHLSKKAGAPVKLMLTRREEHLSVGNRPSSIQSIKIGAKKDGTLTAIQAIGYGTAGTGTGAGFGNPARSLYRCENVLTEESDVFIHAGPAAAFRAPGHPQGVFGFEQAIDELAEKLGMDPLLLREKIDESDSRRVERKIGAEKIGWSNRKPAASDAGPVKRGIGFAQSIWGRYTDNRNSSVEIRITQDGSVELFSAVQDIGGGIKTALAQVAAEELGLKPTDITIKIGNTSYPPGPGSGGSVTTGSITPPARNAAYQVKQEFLGEVASAIGAKLEDLDLVDGKVVNKGDDSKSMSFRAACAKMTSEQVSATSKRGEDYEGEGKRPGLGGVQFVQVVVDTQTGVIHVERVVAVHDCGRPINPLGVENQINGGVIQGLSYALFENRILDRQTGVMVNSNLEQYKIAGSKDMPQIEPVMIEQYLGRSSTDAYGIGEPATVPTAAAIANAVYNAIGVRVREIPMTPAVVLKALAAKA